MIQLMFLACLPVSFEPVSFSSLQPVNYREARPALKLSLNTGKNRFNNRN